MESISNLPPIGIITIAHEQQRYDTLGDYIERDGGVQIRISQTGSLISDAALEIHEFTEALWCLINGVSFKQVDEWDFAHPGMDAGLLPGCPYGPGHKLALQAEYNFLIANGVMPMTHEEHLSRIQP